MSTPVIHLGSFCPVMLFFMGELMSVQSRKESSNELTHDKTNKTDMGPSENSDQPGHPPSLISLCCALNG